MAKKEKYYKQKPPRRPKNAPSADGTLPNVSVLVITHVSEDGEITAEPAKWDPKRKPPHITVTESGRQAAVVKGDRVMAKLRKIRPHFYHALVIRTLPNEQAQNVLGVFVATADGGIIEPISRKMKESFKF